MKILMLVNWKIKYTSSVPEGIQPPDYFVKGRDYWFFRYFKNRDFTLDVMDIKSFRALENFEKNKLRFYVLQGFKAYPKLKNYDVVLSHGMQSGIVLSILRRLFGKKGCKHIVFDIGAFNSARESGKALKFMQFAGKALDGVIYHTESQKSYYEKCHPYLLDKSIFIPFGTDTEFFSAEGMSEKVKGPMAEKYIISVGYNKRDWDTLVKAYEKTTQKYKLLLVGNAEYKTDNKDIKVIPPVQLPTLISYIKGAEFCVLPLENFNYSYGQMTLLQQMALGRAVITADVNSLKAYTEEGIKTGALATYEAGNVDELSERLKEFMGNPALCEKVAKEGALLVEEKFNEKIMAQRIEDFIKTV